MSKSRLNAIRRDLDSVREAAETIADENLDLPRVQAQIERLLDRLVPALERADALADSLRSVAAGIRIVADIVDQLIDDSAATDRVRTAADKIDRAAEALNGLRARVEDSKSAKAVRLARQLGVLAREAIAGSELLAEGLAAARHEIVVVRGQTIQWRNKVVYLDLRDRNRQHARLVVGRLGPTMPDRLGATTVRRQRSAAPRSEGRLKGCPPR